MDFINLKEIVEKSVLSYLKIKITSGDLDESSLYSLAGEHCRGIINSISHDMYDFIVAEKGLKLSDYRKPTEDFLKRLNADWGDGFDLLEIFIAISKELAADWIKDSDFVRNELTMSLIRLQARGCQVASEVLVLLRNGFADGAFARWRTLHEIAVVALFLQKHGIDSAIRYIASDVVEGYKIAKKEIECQEAMGYDGPSVTELEDLKRHVEAVKSKFGKGICNEYGWAAPFIEKEKANFRDIERDVDLERFRRNYGIASANVHAGVKGITFKLSLLDGQDIILSGPSNVGFVEPGHSSAIALLQVNSTFLLLQEPTQAAIYLSIMSIMCNEIGNKLLGSHAEVVKRYDNYGKTIMKS